MSVDGNADDALARRTRDAMNARDRALQWLGIEIVDIGAGFARAVFTVGANMVNGHDVCHGGLLFTLADSAFAYACNSRNESAIALQCSISFAAPARVGDRIEATARERTAGGRTGTYDIDVTGPSGTVALFRGVSYRISGRVIPDS